MTEINIALVDDERLFRSGLRLILENYKDFNVIMEAENGRDLANQLKSKINLPSLVLMDLEMSEMDGIECTKFLKKNYPKIHIIILSTHFSNPLIVNLI